MKILLGVPEYPPHHVGGGGEVFKNLAENYRKMGHEVVVMYGYYPTTSWFEDIKEYTNEDGIKFYQIPEIPYPRSMPFLRTVMPCNVKSFFTLKQIIEKEKPDVAHLHGYGFILINILGRILDRSHIRYIFTIHGYPETQNKFSALVKMVWEGYVRFIMNRTLGHAKRIVCISDYIRNDDRNIGKEKSVTIYNGINFDEYTHVGNDIDVRKKHQVSDGTRIFFSLGRIAEMKGFQEVIKLLPQYIKEGISVKYLIAGSDDGYKKELDCLIQDLHLGPYVEFVGFLGLEEKKQYISQCDVFAIPSIHEPFGLIALEGMVYNKLILTTESGGLKEVLSGYTRKVNLYAQDVVQKLHEATEFKQEDIGPMFHWENIARSYMDQLLSVKTQ